MPDERLDLARRSPARSLASRSPGLRQQPRADPHERGALLDGDLVVLRRAHRQLAQAARRGELAQRGEPAPAVLRLVARAAASSSAPRPARGSARRTRRARAGATPSLPASPATLTSTRTRSSGGAWRPSCSSTESVQTEWMSRTSGAICLTLRLCRWPMKSHVKASPWAATFACEILRAGCTPATVDAALGERGEVVDGDVLHRRDELDLGGVAPAARRRRRDPLAAPRRGSRARARPSGR